MLYFCCLVLADMSKVDWRIT